MSDVESAGPAERRILLEHDVPVVLSDGTTTRADVWRPDDDAVHPAILVRTPYGKETHFHMSPVDPRAAAERGYALVIQDVRGRGSSGGTFRPLAQERADGRETVQWVADRTWCSGEVMMTGPSYVGACAWLAAAERPRGLVAIAPMNSTNDFRDGLFFAGDVREHGQLTAWISAALASVDDRRPDDIESADRDPRSLADIVAEASTWFAAAADDPYWDDLAADATAVEVPVFAGVGWYDIFLRGTLRAFAARDRQDDRLVIGNWGHDNYFSHLVGPRNLGFSGSGEALGIGGLVLDFFESVRSATKPPGPRVRSYVLGAKEWASSRSWPPAGLASATVELPAAEIVVDPGDLPVARGGHWLRVGEPGGNWGPGDQRQLAARADVVRHEIVAAGAQTLIAGPVRARLRVDHDRPGSHMWVVLMCIQQSDGALDVLSEGVARTVDRGELLVELPDVYVEIAPEQSVVVLLSGGLWPRWEPTTVGGAQRLLSGSTLEFGIVSPVPPDVPASHPERNHNA